VRWRPVDAAVDEHAGAILAEMPAPVWGNTGTYDQWKFQQAGQSEMRCSNKDRYEAGSQVPVA
jgi:hypothetical protein